MKWYWLSFADGNLPKGKQFLGVAIVPVDKQVIELIEQLDYTDGIDMLRERGQESDVAFYAAVEYARLLGLNPGGEVEGWEIPGIEKIPEELRGRLLSREQLEDAGLIGSKP